MRLCIRAEGAKAQVVSRILPSCAVRLQAQGAGKPIGVYHVMGDTCKGVCKKTGKTVIGGSTARTVEEGRFAMGVDRPISWNELKEGFPPAYTKHIGEQALRFLRGVAA